MINPNIQVGDTVTRRPITFGKIDKELKNRTIHIPYTGTVLYIHPKRRYYIIGFQTAGGIVRESFC